MADRRFTVEEALTMLRQEAGHHELGLKAEAQRLEEHLRLAFEARDVKHTDLETAEIVHVFEINANSRIQFGARLQLSAWGMDLGGTLVAPEIKPGRYRAVLMLSRLEDDQERAT